MAKAIARTLLAALLAAVLAASGLELAACNQCDCKLSVGMKRSLEVSAAELEGAHLAACADDRCGTATISKGDCVPDDWNADYPIDGCLVSEVEGQTTFQVNVLVWSHSDEVSLSLTRATGEGLIDVRGVGRNTSSASPLSCDACANYEL